jgi:hypothetical protein
MKTLKHRQCGSAAISEFKSRAVILSNTDNFQAAKTVIAEETVASKNKRTMLKKARKYWT